MLSVSFFLSKESLWVTLYLPYGALPACCYLRYSLLPLVRDAFRFAHALRSFLSTLVQSGSRLIVRALTVINRESLAPIYYKHHPANRREQQHRQLFREDKKHTHIHKPQTQHPGVLSVFCDAKREFHLASTRFSSGWISAGATENRSANEWRVKCELQMDTQIVIAIGRKRLNRLSTTLEHVWPIKLLYS